MRILHTLELLGYIRKTAMDTRRRIDRLRIVWSRRWLQCAAGPLRRLAQTTSETASLCALFENHIEVVLVVESPQ